MPGERLLSHFLSYGEVEEGPLGFDKATGKSKGFSLFVYKTAEAARAALVDPIKTIDGHQMSCKIANEGKKGKPSPGAQAPLPSAGPGQVEGSGGANIDQQQNVDGHGLSQEGSVPMPGSFLSHYGGGVHGGITGYGGGLQGQNQNPLVHSHHPGSLNTGLAGGPGLSSLGGGVGAGLSSFGNQAASSLGGSISGLGSGIGGGPYGGSHFGGPGSTYSGLGGAGGGLGGAAVGGLGGFGGGIGGGAGIGLGVSGLGSLYGLPPSTGGYPESAHYSLSSGSVYQNQHHQPTGLHH